MSLARYEPAAGHVPSITERDISLIERQAAIIARTDLAGPLKGKPADVALVGMKALALGVPVAAAFDDFFVIERRVTISARMRVALARAAGCEVWFDQTGDEQATACLRRPGQSRVHRLTYTIHQAQRAGLGNKDNWKKHPAAMLRAAAARQLINMAAQDVMLGLPGGGSVDWDVDVDETPDDVIDHSEPFVDDAPPPAASEADVARLRDRIAGLDEHRQDWLRAQFRAAQLAPLARLDAPSVRVVDELIAAAEALEGVEEPLFDLDGPDGKDGSDG